MALNQPYSSFQRKARVSICLTRRPPPLIGHVDDGLDFELLGEIRLAMDHHPNRDLRLKNL